MHAAPKGGPTGTILDHELTLHAEKFTPGLPPDGTIKPVAGTPFDFMKPKPIGRDLKAAGSRHGRAHRLRPELDRGWRPDAMRPVAKVKEPKSGRVMTVESNEPGVQFYSASSWTARRRVKARCTSSTPACAWRRRSSPT